MNGTEDHFTNQAATERPSLLVAGYRAFFVQSSASAEGAEDRRERDRPWR